MEGSVPLTEAHRSPCRDRIEARPSGRGGVVDQLRNEKPAPFLASRVYFERENRLTRRSLEPTIVIVTRRAPSSTRRAIHNHGSALTFGNRMKIYTAWHDGKTKSCMLVPGEGPPRYLNGSLQPDCEVLLWRIEAATWEEAMAIHNLRQGHGDYVPMGEAKPCPKCGAMYYPEGSGECWRCGKVS